MGFHDPQAAIPLLTLTGLPLLEERWERKDYLVNQNLVLTFTPLIAKDGICLIAEDKTAPPPPPPRTLYLRSGYQITEHTLNYLQTIHSLRSDDPLLITNTFKVKGKYNEIPFCDGAAKIRDLPNAGGSSAHSEILSFEMLNCLLNVKLRATEMELEYYPLGSKITDYSVDIPITKEHQIAIGVSVTRAMKFAGEFDDADAEKLLRKKLMGVNESSKAVLKKFRWTKQILHIWAEHSYISDIVTRIYHTLPADLTSNTIVMITTCERAPWVFYEEADS